MKKENTIEIKKKYLHLIKNEKKELNKNINQYFNVRIDGFFQLTDEEAKQYCIQNSIDLENNYSYKYKTADKAIKWINKNIRNRIFKKIKTAEKTEYSNIISIPREFSEIFYEEFKEQNHLDWGFHGLSKEENFHWTKRILEDGKDKWHWKSLLLNKGIKWNFKLIDKFKEKLDWELVPTINLNWTRTEIIYFKDYLSTEDKNVSVWDYTDHNGNEHFYEESYLNFCGFFSNLSANKYIKWDINLIDEFKRLWDWVALSQNKSVQWNQDKIKKFDGYINMTALSRNVSFNWDEQFISDNIEFLNIDNLINNRSINWTPSLIQKHFQKINFVQLSKSGNISSDSILVFFKIWSQEDKQSHYARIGSEGPWYYSTSHSLWEYLCENKNIIWTENLLTKFLDNIPLKNLCDQRIEVSVDFINKHWDYFKNERTNYYENYYGDPIETYEDIYFRDKIKNCLITDLDFEKFKKNEKKWWGVFCSEKFLNKTISTIIA